MGCDIHAAIEWVSLDGQAGRVEGVPLPHLRRDYRFFGRVAGVRAIGFMRALEGLPCVRTWISIWFDN